MSKPGATSDNSVHNNNLIEGSKAMFPITFPNDPSSRKVVLVLKEHDIERCGYEPDAARVLTDDETYVLQFQHRYHGDVPIALQNIIDAGLARHGNILVQSPYDTDSYEEISLAPQRFALTKHMYFSMLCMHLGAKEVVVEQIELRTRSGKSKLNVEGGRLGGSTQMEFVDEELENFRSQMNFSDKFVGGLPDPTSAEQLLKQKGLFADPNMRTLVEMRRDGTNQLKTRKIVLHLSSEAKSNFNVVGRLNVPKFINLTADYDRVLKEQHDYILTVEVRF